MTVVEPLTSIVCRPNGCGDGVMVVLPNTMTGAATEALCDDEADEADDEADDEAFDVELADEAFVLQVSCCSNHNLATGVREKQRESLPSLKPMRRLGIPKKSSS